MSHLVRKSVTFGKQEPVREKLNCFSLSAYCSKFLLVLPVIWREKCGACSAVSECEGGWVEACQPPLFAMESIAEGWGGSREAPPGHSWRKQLMLSEERILCHYCETDGVGLLAKLIFSTFISLPLKVFVDKTTLRKTIHWSWICHMVSSVIRHWGDAEIVRISLCESVP